MRLSVVIPVYNEEATIADVIDRVTDVAVEKEVIVVDDGSTDRTGDILRARAADLRHIHEGRANFGKGAAVRIGLTYAAGEIIIVQDADLELDPREYSLLIAPIERGDTNVVYGSRFRGANAVPLRTRLANKFLTWLTNVLYGSALTDMETAYKVFRADTVRRLRLTSLRFEIEPEITAKLLRLGERIVEVPIAYRPRSRDEGKKIGWRDGIVAIRTLLACRFADPATFVSRHVAVPTQALTDHDR